MSQLSDRLEVVRDGPGQVPAAVVERARDDDVPFMAGSIAYQAFSSLVPLLVLLFITVTVVGDQQLAGRVVALTQGVFPRSARELLHRSISSEGGVGSASASIIGVVTLVWGSLKIFRGLDKAFSDIYGTDERNSIVDQVKDGLLVLSVLGLGLVGMIGAMAVFGVYDGPLSQVVSLAVLVVVLTLAFLPMYRLFPDTELEWVDAIPGALFAAVGWMALQFLFRLYILFSGRGDSPSIIGAVLLLLLWFYLCGLVLLLGAVVNVVLLGEEGPAVGGGGSDSSDHRAGAPLDRLHRERARRRTLEHERARLARRLERAEAREDEDVSALRRRNRTLRRWLAWKGRPLPVRMLVRWLGTAPPEPDLRPVGTGTRDRGGGDAASGGD